LDVVRSVFLFNEQILLNLKRKSPSIEDWNDVVQTYFCLFCDKSFEIEDEIINHMIETHKFDLKAIMTQNELSFYSQVKFVNYIRQQVKNKLFKHYIT
jgi:hypothetical protein